MFHFSMRFVRFVQAGSLTIQIGSSKLSMIDSGPCQSSSVQFCRFREETLADWLCDLRDALVKAVNAESAILDGGGGRSLGEESLATSKRRRKDAYGFTPDGKRSNPYLLFWML